MFFLPDDERKQGRAGGAENVRVRVRNSGGYHFDLFNSYLFYGFCFHSLKKKLKMRVEYIFIYKSIVYFCPYK